LLDYVRHFRLLALAALGLSLAAFTKLGHGFFGSQGGIRLAFALYGALHALALVLSLRTGGILRRITFVATAAALSAAVTASALTLAPRAPHPSITLILVGAAALGALLYAGAIRAVLRVRLEPRVFLATISVCAAALIPATSLLGEIPRTDGLVLAIPWWVAFSLALFVTDAARARPSKIT
jgi:hypothetical protein